MAFIPNTTRLLYGFNDKENTIRCIYVSEYTSETGETILVTKPVDDTRSTLVAPMSMFRLAPPLETEIKITICSKYDLLGGYITKDRPEKFTKIGTINGISVFQHDINTRMYAVYDPVTNKYIEDL